MEERALLDHPVGQCEQFRRYVASDRLCGLEVEHEFKCRWLLIEGRRVWHLSIFYRPATRPSKVLRNQAR